MLEISKKSYLKHPHFSHSNLFDHFVILALKELLDGNYLPRLLVLAFEHHAIAALTNQAQILILLHRSHHQPIKPHLKNTTTTSASVLSNNGIEY